MSDLIQNLKSGGGIFPLYDKVYPTSFWAAPSYRGYNSNVSPLAPGAEVALRSPQVPHYPIAFFSPQGSDQHLH